MDNNSDFETSVIEDPAVEDGTAAPPELPVGPFRMKLCRPINSKGDITIDEIVIQEPTLKHLIMTDRHPGEAAKMAVLLSALTGLPPQIVERLSAADVARAQEFISPFLDQTGKAAF